LQDLVERIELPYRTRVSSLSCVNYAIDRHSVEKQVWRRNCSSATTTVLELVNTEAHALEERGKKQVMSALSSDSRDTFDALSLSVLLEPMQFKAALMVTCGLEIHQVAQCLGTTEQIIRNVLLNAYDRTHWGARRGHIRLCHKRQRRARLRPACDNACNATRL
jgi:hypothetical protein